jgi:hypothetical protein
MSNSFLSNKIRRGREDKPLSCRNRLKVLYETGQVDPAIDVSRSTRLVAIEYIILRARLLAPKILGEEWPSVFVLVRLCSNDASEETGNSSEHCVFTEREMHKNPLGVVLTILAIGLYNNTPSRWLVTTRGERLSADQIDFKWLEARLQGNDTVVFRLEDGTLIKVDIDSGVSATFKSPDSCSQCNVSTSVRAMSNLKSTRDHVSPTHAWGLLANGKKDTSSDPQSPSNTFPSDRLLDNYGRSFGQGQCRSLWKCHISFHGS